MALEYWRWCVRTAAVEVSVDVGEVVVARCAQSELRGLGFQAQDGVDVFFLDIVAEGSPFKSLLGSGACAVVSAWKSCGCA